MGRGLGPIQRKCIAVLRESPWPYLRTSTVVVGVFGMPIREDQESRVRRALASLWRRGKVIRLSRSRQYGEAVWALPERLEMLLGEVARVFGQRAAEAVRQMVKRPQAWRLRGDQAERGKRKECGRRRGAAIAAGAQAQ